MRTVTKDKMKRNCMKTEIWSVQHSQKKRQAIRYQQDFRIIKSLIHSKSHTYIYVYIQLKNIWLYYLSHERAQETLQSLVRALKKKAALQQKQ